MNEDDRRDMALRVMFETLGTSAPTPAQIAGYRLALDDIPVGSLEMAIKKALRVSRSLPRPAEIRDLVPRPSRSYVGESAAEKKRIYASWEPVRKALAVAAEGDGDPR